jgi:ribosomal-protein-alanine N-acetyltransferase
MTAASPDNPRRRLVVRRAVPSDLGGIMAIENVSFPTPWSESTMRRELADTDAGTYLCADVCGRVAGYVGAWIYSGECHILNIAVSPDFRGTGLGEILMLGILDVAILKGCDNAMLEYRVGNSTAEALYLKLGFVVVGRRPNYYFDTNEDASLATLADLQTLACQASLAHLRELWEHKHEHEWALEVA